MEMIGQRQILRCRSTTLFFIGSHCFFIGFVSTCGKLANNTYFTKIFKMSKCELVRERVFLVGGGKTA